MANCIDNKICLEHKLIIVDNNSLCELCGLIVEQNLDFCEEISYSSKQHMSLIVDYKENLIRIKRLNFEKLVVNIVNQVDKTLLINVLSVLSLSSNILYLISKKKENNGKILQKSKIKHALILLTICSLYKNIDLKKTLKLIDLDIKYISKVEILINELIANKDIPIDYFTINQNPLLKITSINNNVIPDYILKDTNNMFIQLSSNITFLEHTPYSLSVSCLYYLLEKNKFSFNLAEFCFIYNLSMTTITKIIYKIKNHSHS